MKTSTVVPLPARLLILNVPFSARTRWRMPTMPCDSRLDSTPERNPAPSSCTISDTPSSSPSNSTSTLRALAYLTTLVRASWTMR
jgi:hypothetical protein